MKWDQARWNPLKVGRKFDETRIANGGPHQSLESVGGPRCVVRLGSGGSFRVDGGEDGAVADAEPPDGVVAAVVAGRKRRHLTVEVEDQLVGHLPQHPHPWILQRTAKKKIKKTR